MYGLIVALSMFLASHRVPLNQSLDGAMAAVAEQIGLTPEVLLAGGLSPTDGAAMAGRLLEAETERGQLAAAQAALDTATAQLATANAQLAADPANETLRQNVQNAATQVRSARQSLRTAKTTVFGVATAGMTTQAVTNLRSARSASARHVPKSFMAASIENWDAVEAAALAEQRANQQGESVPQDAASLLSQIRAQAAVVSAEQALSTQLEAMRAAFAS